MGPKKFLDLYAYNSSREKVYSLFLNITSSNANALLTYLKAFGPSKNTIGWLKMTQRWFDFAFKPVNWKALLQISKE